MPINLDQCISNVYEPGNIPTDTGDDPSEPSLFIPSFDFTLTENCQYIPLICW